jgi:flagellar basal-body rod protein FlgC
VSDFSKALSVSSSGLQAQSARIRLLAENISNADTPGYRRKTVPFEAVFDPNSDLSKVEAGRVRLDRSELERVYDPGHPLADESGHYESSNVNLLLELADAREARRSYDANLKMFEQARAMSSGLLQLLRR